MGLRHILVKVSLSIYPVIGFIRSLIAIGESCVIYIYISFPPHINHISETLSVKTDMHIYRFLWLSVSYIAIGNWNIQHQQRLPAHQYYIFGNYSVLFNLLMILQYFYHSMSFTDILVISIQLVSNCFACWRTRWWALFAMTTVIRGACFRNHYSLLAYDTNLNVSITWS